MKIAQANYKKYGRGRDILIAFHGYGMDGGQFEIFARSLCEQYLIIGFHLPYHQHGSDDHLGWLQAVNATISELLLEHEVERFSLAGYSIGSKIALSILNLSPDKIENLILFAPFGVNNHWGLVFVSKGFGNWFFRTVVNSSIPSWIMKLSTRLNILDQEHNAIIQKELSDTQKRKALCSSLAMVGEIDLNLRELINSINENQISVKLIYGRDDVVFPYRARNRQFINRVNQCEVIPVDAGHWMMTPRLDRLLVENGIKS